MSGRFRARLVPMAVPKLPPPKTTTLRAASEGLSSAPSCCRRKNLLQRISASQLSWIWLRSEGGYSAPLTTPSVAPSWLLAPALAACCDARRRGRVRKPGLLLSLLGVATPAVTAAPPLLLAATP